MVDLAPSPTFSQERSTSNGAAARAIRLEDGNLRMLLLDPQALVRQTLRAALENRAGFRIVAEARDASEAVSTALTHDANLALVHGLEQSELVHTIEVLREHAPGCRVIVIGAEEDMGTLMAALDAGASGFFTKTSPFSELVEAAGDVSRGRFLLPRSMIEELLARLLERRSEEMLALRLVAKLTARERDVLSLLAGGGGNEGIGQALMISPQTVRTHVQRILAKLGLHSRLEAVAFVRRLGRHAQLLRPPG